MLLFEEIARLAFLSLTGGFACVRSLAQVGSGPGLGECVSWGRGGGQIADSTFVLTLSSFTCLSPSHWTQADRTSG